MPVRAAAARAVAAVVGGRALDDALAEQRERVDVAQRPLLQELAYGAVRHWLRLEPRVRGRLRKPLRARDADLRALLVVAVYDLEALRTPDHAAVDAAVDATAALGKGWARGLVNGVLRALLRESAPRAAAPADAHGWPHWLAAELAADWPDEWPAIAASGTERAPMTLRVNLRRASRAGYAERLAAAGIESRAHPFAPAALVLAEPVPVDRLPGFAEGDVSVQDAAAQLAAPLLAPVGDCRVLDACAAPGGKTGHLAELHPAPARLLALEVDPDRAERMRAGLARLRAAADIVVGDAGEPAAWWDGVAFDRILLDVPCSGTGVIRRHPDIRLLRRPGDIDAMTARQARLLDAMWPLLAPGGMLVYATCSILRDENAAQIEAFLRRAPDASTRALDGTWGREDGPGRQILPGEQDMDGFFYACLVRSEGP
jgi:16S rRNA (cytosine967-C5)-methyltransferase